MSDLGFSGRRGLLGMRSFAALAIAAAVHGCGPRQPAAPAAGRGHDHGHGTPGEPAHAGEIKLTPEAVALHGVKVEEAQLWVLRPTFTVPARVVFNAERVAHVSPLLRGRVVEWRVRVGDEVKPGDPLLVVESAELGQAQSDFLVKRTTHEAAGPQVELARSAWERAKGLYEQSQGVSLTEVQRREAEYRGALANQMVAAGALAAGRSNLLLLGMDDAAVDELVRTGSVSPRLVVRAPTGGQILERNAAIGEMVGPERAELTVIADPREPWVVAEVGEARLGGVTPGATAWITLTDDGPRHEGHVALVSATVDPTTRTGQVRIEVKAPSFAAKAGAFASVEIAEQARDEATLRPRIAVPDGAIQTVAGMPAVFVPVAGEPNTFKKRVVVTGARVGGLVPIVSGLVEGEAYVSGGSFILKAELGKGSAAHEH